MSSPWKIEVAGLTRPARRFLSRVRMGGSLENAAARARLTPGEVKTWLRSDERFLHAYQEAHRGVGRPRVINPLEYLGEEQLHELARAYVEQHFSTDQLGIIRGDPDGRTGF